MAHYRPRNLRPLAALAFGLCATQPLAAETVWLDQLNLRHATQSWGDPQKDKSVDGHPLRVGGKTFQRGFGTHAESTLVINLDGGAQRFSAIVGLDDEVKSNTAASVQFFVNGDDRTLWQSAVLHAGASSTNCDVAVSGVKRLTLKVGDAGDGIGNDHADWADAKFTTATATNFAVINDDIVAPVAPYILTPPAPALPRINGPNVFGVRPGSPFLYTIPATGTRPMEFSSQNLPAGLKLDSKTGRITGELAEKGEFAVTLIAKNSLGAGDKKFRIVCGDQMALTPPMGWNSWNCFAGAVTQDRVKRAADAMVRSGLINHGWSYINVDDYWQNHRNSKDPTLQGPPRDTNGCIVPNARFPDMKDLADYIHSLGLKAGLYSSPGPWTCGSCAGSWKYEQQDAQTYANWGFDYLKYDWCSYDSIWSTDDPAVQEIPRWKKSSTNDAGAIYPYAVMGKFLREQKRDIVFSLCQYGWAEVWKWGGSVDGNCWRTTGDIIDTWPSMSQIGFRQDQAASYAKPGNWNDPDMLIVGEVGWGKMHPSRLTADEQYTHISLWCLLSAPLLIGCDMEKLDNFTLNLLCNDEVLAVNQDALGKQATCVLTESKVKIYAKDLEDGSRAVGFFNLGAKPAEMKFKNYAALNLAGKQTVRDLWRQKDIATVDAAKDSLPLTIPPHGVVLYKFTAPK